MKEDKNKKVKQEHINKDSVKKEDKKEDKELTITITKEEIESMNQKLKEAEEKAVRAQADLVNYRKRKDEETSRIVKYANVDIVLELLTVLDNFERAFSLNSDDLNEESQKIYDGMRMIYSGLLNVLTKFEVKEIDCLDKKFDPMYHNAVMTEENKDKEVDTILEVLQKGYLLKDKVIRPAMVKVNK